MKKKDKTPIVTPRELLIDRLYSELKAQTTESPEFEKAFNYLQVLEAPVKKDPRWYQPSPDAVVAAFASVAQVVVVVGAESLGNMILNSKGMNMVAKPKIY